MRVLCINAGPNEDGMSPEEIKEGETYEVIRRLRNSRKPFYQYELEGCFYYYGEFRFIPCSNQENVVLENVLVTVNK